MMWTCPVRQQDLTGSHYSMGAADMSDTSTPGTPWTPPPDPPSPDGGPPPGDGGHRKP